MLLEAVTVGDAEGSAAGMMGLEPRGAGVLLSVEDALAAGVAVALGAIPDGLTLGEGLAKAAGALTP